MFNTRMILCLRKHIEKCINLNNNPEYNLKYLNTSSLNIKIIEFIYNAVRSKYPNRKLHSY